MESLLLVAVAVALCHHSSRLVNAAVWASRGEEKGEPAGRLGFPGLDRMRLLLALVLFAKSLLRTTGCLASRMLREHWRWVVIPAAWALMSYLILDYTSSQVAEKRQESLASMCDERARMLQYQVNVSMNSLQALAILISTFHHSKNPSSAIDQVGRYTCSAIKLKEAFFFPAVCGESHLI